MVDVKLGQQAQITIKRNRTDGLVERQVIMAKVTYVDDFRFEWKVLYPVASENMLQPATEGGFTRKVSPEMLRKLGCYLM